MSAPKYVIQANRQTDGEVMHERNPSWVVAFVRFQEPAAAYVPNANRSATKPILVIENDCLDVVVDNQKGSYTKSCTMRLRAGEVFYPGAVANGDWCFVWMSDYQDEMNDIIDSLNALNANQQPRTPLNDWKSGLKFVGRVSSVGVSDTVQDGGVRPYIQTISATAFLEFGSSVYYSETAQYIFTQSFGNAQTGSTILQQNGLDVALGGLGQKFVQFFTSSSSAVQLYPPPDIAIAFYLVIAMGISSNQQILGQLGLPSTGLLSDAIEVPNAVSKILGKPTASKLWQLLNVYLGLQKYSSSSVNPWVNFSPTDTVFPSTDAPVFFKTPDRLKGWVPFYPVAWDNKPLWSILNQYLNPTLNEMYTALRCDQFGFIRPTIVAREQPFGTALFASLQNKKVQPIAPADPTQVQSSNKLTPSPTGQQTAQQLAASQTNLQNQDSYQKFLAQDLFNHTNQDVRALYANQPRWVLDESMIKSVNVASYEQDRVNFVQVWGRNAFATLGPPSGTGDTNIIELDKEAQLSGGNMVSDDADIRRNGLRANVSETPFDYPLPLNSRAPLWARMRADWLFNGHLKVRGTVQANGVREPICEGDNLQVRGLVFHILGVTHEGHMTANGKQFTTTLSVFNGMLARSLDTGSVPSYLYHQGPVADDQRYIPGVTDIEYTTKSNRAPNGERGGGVPS